MTEKNNSTLNKEIMSSDSQESNILSSAQIGRSQFELAMVEKGLISQEFYESGALERFNLNLDNGHDSLKHILIGSDRGGLHHLSSHVELGNKKTKIASSIGGFKKSSKSLSKHRSSQKIKENGVYRAGDIVISSHENQRFIKRAGSTMFPNDWSTQDVLEAILNVANQDGISVGEDDNMRIIHKSVVNGVNIEVITSSSNGKILTAFPI
jgi:hypothetical protein